MSAARKSLTSKDEDSKEPVKTKTGEPPRSLLDQMRNLDPDDVYTVDQFLSLLHTQAHERQTRVLLGFLSNLWGPDVLVLKAGQLDAMSLLRSNELRDRLTALLRLVYEDSTIEIPAGSDFGTVLSELEDQIADLVAMRTVEEHLDRRIAEKMNAHHNEYEGAALARPATKADLAELTEAVKKNTETLETLMSGLGISGEGSEILESLVELHLKHAKEMANTAIGLNSAVEKMVARAESQEESWNG
jgi:hypothetical protein